MARNKAIRPTRRSRKGWLRKMVLPVGTFVQNTTIVTKTSQGVTGKRTIAVRFVPMVGRPR